MSGDGLCFTWHKNCKREGYLLLSAEEAVIFSALLLYFNYEAKAPTILISALFWFSSGDTVELLIIFCLFSKHYDPHNVSQFVLSLLFLSDLGFSNLIAK